MMAQFWRLRAPLAAALAVGSAFGPLFANEPIAAPPAPSVTAIDEVVIAEPAIQESGAGAPALAPVSTDGAPGPIVPAARRSTDRSLAPTTIGSEPAYMPGSGNSAQLYPVSTPQVLSAPEATAMSGGYGGEVVTYGQEYVYGDTPLDEATVRISDKPADQQTGQVPGVRPSSRICPECRYCEHGLPYHQCPHCEPDPKMVRQYRRKHGVIYPPDYGWSPPANHPIDRISIDYYRAFPAAWNGQQQPGPAVVRPTVYWPTDTTQLGYTYQHSPRWMPYPGMVPPVPHPGQWHVPLYNHQAMGGPCPHCRGNAAVPLAQNGTRQQTTNTPGQPSWTPTDAPLNVTDVAELPAGPALNAAPGTPQLTPVPF
jgi:hypothetical protein